MPPGSGTVTLTVPNFVQDRKKLTMVAVGLAAVVLVLGVAVILKKSDSSPPAPVAVVPARVAPVQEPPKVEPPAAPAAAPASGLPATPVADASKHEPAKAEPPKGDPAKPPAASAKPEPGKIAEATKAADPAKAAAAVAAAGGIPPATLVFAIQPWGEVFVNGKSIGVSPPTKSWKLPPGKYRIEVRNTTFAAYAETMDLKARDEVTIRHRFQ